MKKAIILSFFLLAAVCTLRAQTPQDYDARIQQDQEALDNASRRYKEQSRKNNRQIDLLEDSISRDQMEIDRLKPALKSAKEILKANQDQLKLQKSKVKEMKKAGATSAEIKLANIDTKTIQAKIRDSKAEIKRIDNQIKKREVIWQINSQYPCHRMYMGATA